MAIRGNNALMVNPITVNPISSGNLFRRYGQVYRSSSWSPAIFEGLWNAAVADYMSASWEQREYDSPTPTFYGLISGLSISFPSVAIYRYKRVFRFNLSEEAIGYAPNQIQKACMRYSVNNWNNIPNMRCDLDACMFKGSVNNVTTGETGIFKELFNGYSVINFHNIPVLDFGNSAKDYSLKPSLDENNPEALKPTYVDANLGLSSYAGFYTRSAPQIIFIPKT